MQAEPSQDPAAHVTRIEPAAVLEVLALHDDEFVAAAYLLVLGREVDPGGMVNYLRQVRTGRSRHSIIAELAASPEGRQRGVVLEGFLELGDEYFGPPPSRLTRWVLRTGGLLLAPILRHLRLLDNTAGRIEVILREHRQQLDALGGRLDALPGAPAAPRHLRAPATGREGRHAAHPSASEPGPTTPVHHSPRFRQLKRAIESKRAA